MYDVAEQTPAGPGAVFLGTMPPSASGVLRTRVPCDANVESSLMYLRSAGWLCVLEAIRRLQTQSGCWSESHLPFRGRSGKTGELQATSLGWAPASGVSTSTPLHPVLCFFNPSTPARYYFRPSHLRCSEPSSSRNRSPQDFFFLCLPKRRLFRPRRSPCSTASRLSSGTDPGLRLCGSARRCCFPSAASLPRLRISNS